MSADDHPIVYCQCCAHMQRAHGSISRCGRQALTKDALFVILVASAKQIEAYRGWFSFADSDRSFRLQVS